MAKIQKSKKIENKQMKKKNDKKKLNINSIDSIVIQELSEFESEQISGGANQHIPHGPPPPPPPGNTPPFPHI